MWKSTRNVLVLISCLLIGSPAYAKTPIEAPELRPGIRVRVYNYAEVPTRTLQRAQKQAAPVLDRAGVTTRWLNCLPAQAPRFGHYRVAVLPAAVAGLGRSRAGQ